MFASFVVIPSGSGKAERPTIAAFSLTIIEDDMLETKPRTWGGILILDRTPVANIRSGRLLLQCLIKYSASVSYRPLCPHNGDLKVGVHFSDGKVCQLTSHSKLALLVTIQCHRRTDLSFQLCVTRVKRS